MDVCTLTHIQKEHATIGQNRRRAATGGGPEAGGEAACGDEAPEGGGEEGLWRPRRGASQGRSGDGRGHARQPAEEDLSATGVVSALALYVEHCIQNLIAPRRRCIKRAGAPISAVVGLVPC